MIDEKKSMLTWIYTCLNHGLKISKEYEELYDPNDPESHGKRVEKLLNKIVKMMEDENFPIRETEDLGGWDRNQPLHVAKRNIYTKLGHALEECVRCDDCTDLGKEIQEIQDDLDAIFVSWTE